MEIIHGTFDAGATLLIHQRPQKKSALSIDGSIGEGGGQILRTSLTLSLITGLPFTLTNIRCRRKKPGLMAQHLKAVEAASKVGMANVEGARLGSQSLTFEPTCISPGNFELDIGTAGSSSLVLQTILPSLSLATAKSTITLIGGTHVPWSPCFHFLAMHWVPYMRRIGFNLQLELEAAGFYPLGGGRVHAVVQPASKLSPLYLTNRGRLKRIRGISAVANLNASVAERQREQALRRLSEVSKTIEIEIVRLPSPSKGTLLLLLADFENSQCCFQSLGARGKPAERVSDEAVGQLLDFLKTDGSVDPFLCDQLVLPLSLATGVSEVRTSKVTLHLATNAEIVKMFLPVEIEIEGTIGQAGSVRIRRNAQ